ncbi:hypothetical protein QO011_007276 [Labrys wisconsinensis]|uniref:Uncharacterized protein n=1 Tax=Labrys wisconsinensis TaxID=425677 RepID=A0ABU0JIX5_9HYPH|nr:hypothetical protein [Labrys wisconsinensis]
MNLPGVSATVVDDGELARFGTLTADPERPVADRARRGRR